MPLQPYHVAAPLEWQRGAEDLGSPLVRGEWRATRVILPAVEAYIVVERRVVGCTDMLAIAVQRVTRMQLGGGRERCAYVGRRIEAPALIGVRRAELEGEAERARARKFVRVVLAVVAAPAVRAAAAAPAPSRACQCHPAQ